MAKVWFVRRLGDEWVAPGGQPAYEAPLSTLAFRLDLGPQRLLVNEKPKPALHLPPEAPSQLRKVIVETVPADLDQEFSWFQVGFYDSPYSPAEVVRRLGAPRSSMVESPPSARPSEVGRSTGDEKRPRRTRTAPA